MAKNQRPDPDQTEIDHMPGEFVLMPPSVFDRAHDNVTADDMIGDSHSSIRTFRLEFPLQPGMTAMSVVERAQFCF